MTAVFALVTLGHMSVLCIQHLVWFGYHSLENFGMTVVMDMFAMVGLREAIWYEPPIDFRNWASWRPRTNHV